MTTSERVVSVIVPVRNDADRLQRALNSIKAGSGPVDQIIVVDNCSTDESREIALRLADVVLEYDGSVGQCRQLGASLARNELLLFLDADQVVLENTVKRAVETLVGSGSDAVELPERPLCNQGWLMSVVAHERRYSELSGVGIPRLILREVFLANSNPSSRLVFGEDWAACKGVRSRALSTIPVLHEDLRVRQLLRKYFDYGFRSGRSTQASAAAFGIGERAAALTNLAKELWAREAGWLVAVAALKGAKWCMFQTGLCLGRIAQRMGSPMEE